MVKATLEFEKLDTYNADDRGRVTLGKDYADVSVELAITEVTDHSEADQQDSIGKPDLRSFVHRVIEEYDGTRVSFDYLEGAARAHYSGAVGADRLKDILEHMVEYGILTRRETSDSIVQYRLR